MAINYVEAAGEALRVLGPIISLGVLPFAGVKLTALTPGGRLRRQEFSDGRRELTVNHYEYERIEVYDSKKGPGSFIDFFFVKDFRPTIDASGQIQNRQYAVIDYFHETLAQLDEDNPVQSFEVGVIEILAEFFLNLNRAEIRIRRRR